MVCPPPVSKSAFPSCFPRIPGQVNLTQQVGLRWERRGMIGSCFGVSGRLSASSPTWSFLTWDSLASSGPPDRVGKG